MNDHASKWKGLAWIVAACIMAAAFALGLSPLAHAIPWSWEKKLGSALEQDVSQQECRSDLRAQALLQRLIDRIYPVQPGDSAFSIEVKVVKNPVVNAYATFGGKIYVNSGLLKQAESPEELAGVLAYEIGHLHNRHILQGNMARLFTSLGIAIVFGTSAAAANWTNYLMDMGFSRPQEAQADEDGLARLQKAHVDNQGFRRFFERMAKSGSAPVFLSDHPSNQSRMEMVDRFVNQDVAPIMTRDDWKILKNYCSA